MSPRSKPIPCWPVDTHHVVAIHLEQRAEWMSDPDSPEALGSAAAPNPPVQRPADRESLDKQRIVAAAVALIDAEGLKSFTMRRLGMSLGVEAMALYHYIHGREDLLDGIVEFVIDD